MECPRAVGELRKVRQGVRGIPEGEERVKGTEEMSEAQITGNFPKIMSDTKP